MAMPWVSPSTGPRVDFGESYDTSSLKGRSALITGGSTGIGLGCVEGLAEAGVYVTFCDVKEDVGKQVEQELKAKGLNVQFVKTDVTSWSETVAAFKKCIQFSPNNTVDIVIPNAGVAGPSLGYWLQQTPKDDGGDPLDPPLRTVSVNYIGVYMTVHAAMYYFKNHSGAESDIGKSKVIILVASMGGYNPMPTVVDYNSSKWGVRGMFWSLRNIANILGENKPKFRVNLIAPTWVKTNMTKGFQDRIAGADSAILMAEVSDCVDVVLRMSSDENVKGRAAAIAAEKKSFDLRDESEGLGVGEVLSDPEYLKFFGYGPIAEAQKKKDGAEATTPETEATVTPTGPEKAVEKDPIAVNGLTVDAPVADPAGLPAIRPLEVTPKAEVIVPVTQATPVASN